MNERRGHAMVTVKYEFGWIRFNIFEGMAVLTFRSFRLKNLEGVADRELRVIWPNLKV